MIRLRGIAENPASLYAALNSTSLRFLWFAEGKHECGIVDEAVFREEEFVSFSARGVEFFQIKTMNFTDIRAATCFDGLACVSAKNKGGRVEDDARGIFWF